MKKSSVLILMIGFTLALTACAASNRLTDSLTTREPGAEVAVAAPTPDGRNLQPLLAEANINLDDVVSLLPPDGIPAVWPDEVDNLMVSAAEADAAGMDPNERIIGVSIEGESRAYPIPFMSQHEIVNDNVGGRLVAATW